MALKKIIIGPCSPLGIIGASTRAKIVYSGSTTYTSELTGTGSTITTTLRTDILTKSGDRYIYDACSMICDHFKRSPVFRVGGDEFVVILEGRDYDERESLLRQINQKIEKNVGTLNVVISLGAADYDPATDLKFHTVFERADERMYQRKTELKKMGAITRD